MKRGPRQDILRFGNATIRRRSDGETIWREDIMTKQSKRKPEEPQIVAGNGLLDRRMLLGRGIAIAGALGTGVGGSLTSAAAEPLPVDPWSLTPGEKIPAYGVAAKYDSKVARTLTNPNHEPRTSPARTPHHLATGTITPNRLPL